MVTSRVGATVGLQVDPRGLLLETGLFDHVPHAQVDALVAHAPVRHFAADEVLLDCHSNGDYLRLLLTGVAKLHTTSASGAEVILSVLHPGELFGEESLLDDVARVSVVTGILPTSVLLVHRRDLDARPGQTALYRGLAQLMVRRVRLAESRHATMLSADSQQRIVRGLLDLAAGFARPGLPARYVALPIRQRDLAAMTGVARETANRALTTLEVAGAVAMTSRQAITVDPARLRAWLRDT